MRTVTKVKNLSSKQRQILARLSDPENAAPIDDLFAAYSVSELFEAAEKHNVSSIIYRKLQNHSSNAPPALSAQIETMKQYLRIQAATMMDLEFRGAKLSGKLHEAGIENRVVKGQIFANDLYRNANDRPYTDVDIVIDENRLPQAIKVANTIGLKHSKREHFDNTFRDQEVKLILPGSPHLLFEIHGNLVHMRALRKNKKIGLPELSLAYDWDTPFVGHFTVAVAHASLGHKFHNLKLMVDILQAMRKLSDNDFPHLAKVINSLNIGLETKACLDLCSSIFSSDDVISKAATISDNLSLSKPSRIVRALDVMQAPFQNSFQSRWRRRLFRLSQL